MGGAGNGMKIPATVVANDGTDFLVSVTLNGQTSYIYATNDPANQPAVGSSVTVGALGPNNPYVYAVTCFASGTLIRTSSGEVAVDALRVGDQVVTASGRHRPIKWLGHRTIDCRLHPHPQGALPVRIAAHAFAPDMPARDLLVSPGHSICIDALGGVLVPAIALVNGSTIAQLDVDKITYWHVELDEHDILLAEGLATESYLDMGNRGFFREADIVVLDVAPDARAKTHAEFCLPFYAEGVVVDALKLQLARRAEAISLPRRDKLEQAS